jgi:hypothetical protein
MSTVFPDADALLAEPPADDEELLEQPAAAITAIAIPAIAGVSFLPFKVWILLSLCSLCYRNARLRVPFDRGREDTGGLRLENPTCREG